MKKSSLILFKTVLYESSLLLDCQKKNNTQFVYPYLNQEFVIKTFLDATYYIYLTSLASVVTLELL